MDTNKLSNKPEKMPQRGVACNELASILSRVSSNTPDGSMLYMKTMTTSR